MMLFLLCLFYNRKIKSNLVKKMGCTDSQVKKPTQTKIENGETHQPRHMLPTVDDQIDEGGQSPFLNKKNKNKKNAKSLGKKNKMNKQQLGRKEGSPESKENKLKVRKAKEIKNKPEDEKFINVIVSKAKKQLQVEHPNIPVVGHQFIKPVVQYSPHKKGAILPEENELQVLSRWQKLITEQGCPSPTLNINNSYISVNESSKTTFRQRQIEERLEHIRNGRFEQSQSGQLLRLYSRKPDFQSNQTIYL